MHADDNRPWRYGPRSDLRQRDIRRSPRLHLPGNQTIEFAGARVPARSQWLTAEAALVNGKIEPVAIVFGPENGAVSERLVYAAGQEANGKKDYVHLIVIGFAIEANARKPLMRHAPGDHLLFALDDTPTARYGPKVQGAGVHHNPTPGPAGEKFLYDHIWVTLAWLARHPAWDTLALPLRALLYVRARDVPKLAKRYP